MSVLFNSSSRLSPICFKSSQAAFLSTAQTYSHHFYLLCQEEQAEDCKTDCDCKQINCGW